MKTMVEKAKAGNLPSGAVILLQGILVDLVNLSIQGKQAHWNVTGPMFRPLHEMFDEMVDQYRKWYDDVAERIRALGEAPDGRLQTVTRDSRVEEIPSDLIRDVDAIAMLTNRVKALIERTRKDLDHLGALDLVTQDRVIGIVEGLEKQVWMLRSQI